MIKKFLGELSRLFSGNTSTSKSTESPRQPALEIITPAPEIVSTPIQTPEVVVPEVAAENEPILSPEVQQVQKMIKAKTPVRISRTAGGFVVGLISEITSDGRHCSVSFIEAESRKVKTKVVRTDDLLSWQDGTELRLELPIANETEISEIINKNIARMQDTREGGMVSVLLRESMGGNTDDIDGARAVTINFYFDPQSGLIRYFGNMQNVPRGIVAHSAHGAFIMTLQYPVKSGSGQEIRRLLNMGTGGFKISNMASRILEASMIEYNQRQLTN